MGAVGQYTDADDVRIKGATDGTLIGNVNDQLKVVAGPSSRQTYSVCVDDLAPAALATDVLVFTGSSTKTVYITYVQITTTASAGLQIDIELLKRSSANTGGTSSALVAVPHDSANAAATATARAYTANPTVLGTSVGVLRTKKATAVSDVKQNIEDTEWHFGDRNNQAIVLRGTSEFLTVNFDGATLLGGNVDICVEWVEE